MFQDPNNKGNIPKVDTPEVADMTTQAASIIADKAAAAGAQIQEAKDKVQQASRIACRQPHMQVLPGK